MLAHFVTPAESRLREKSFRNAEYVHSPYLISHLLGRCRGVCMCVFDIGMHGHSKVRTYGCSMVHRCGRSTLRRYGRSTLRRYRRSTDMGVQIQI